MQVVAIWLLCNNIQGALSAYQVKTALICIRYAMAATSWTAMYYVVRADLSMLSGCGAKRATYNGPNARGIPLAVILFDQNLTSSYELPAAPNLLKLLNS